MNSRPNALALIALVLVAFLGAGATVQAQVAQPFRLITSSGAILYEREGDFEFLSSARPGDANQVDIQLYSLDKTEISDWSLAETVTLIQGTTRTRFMIILSFATAFVSCEDYRAFDAISDVSGLDGALTITYSKEGAGCLFAIAGMYKDDA